MNKQINLLNDTLLLLSNSQKRKILNTKKSYCILKKKGENIFLNFSNKSFVFKDLENKYSFCLPVPSLIGMLK